MDLEGADNLLDGTVFGRNMQRHGHQEFIRFLNAVEGQIPAGKVVHVIVDNYAAHKLPKVRGWLDRHPRWTFHFTPTSCSWLRAVEGFFARLAKRRLKRGVFRSVHDLQAAINRFVDEHNRNHRKPFVWTADPDRIIAAVSRGHQMLDLIHYDVVKRTDGAGEPVRGERTINEAEAEIVRSIFREFSACKSRRAIARRLNDEGVPGPAGALWTDSTLRGHAKRGTGIIKNELYVGRLVWNRLRYVKDPTTGKRVSRINPPEDWSRWTCPSCASWTTRFGKP